MKTVRNSRIAITVAAALLLGTCAPLPSVLDQIKILGELRVVTRDSFLSFTRGAGGLPAGLEYELARGLADELGVSLKFTVVPGPAEMYSALRSGRAHLAAAALKIPAKSVNGVRFGPVYERVREHLVYRHGALRPDLDSLPNFAWIESADLDARARLDGVANGSLEYAIADSTEFALAHDAHPDLRIAFDFPDSRSLAWAVGARDDGILRIVTEYFAGLDSRGDLAEIVNRYYGRSEDLQFAGTRIFARHLQSRLPLYKKWFEEAAQQGGQDWRLLAAIGYQESKWDPRAASAAGAKGLMQLTGVTATAAKVDNPADPRQSIFGGARYYREVYAKIPTHVPEPDHTWFALAAYNIGYGHLEDARVLTQRAGRDPDCWDDVREFLPLLEQEAWYTQTENGYARGREPVRYVDNVRDYRDMLEWAWGSNGAAALN